MFQPGDDVLVQFDGEELRGEVVEQHHGWFLTRVLIDPEVDFGESTARLDPTQLVMVRESELSAYDGHQQD
jgi:hypothetical protein